VTEAVIFPDVELWATGYLRGALATSGYPGIFVSNRRESQTVAVWVRRDGGPADVVTEDARLGVNVFAATEQAVNDLARTVSALMRAAPGNGPAKWVRQPMGPSPITDNQPRRYMTFEVRVKGQALNPA
jgi:hypothetical protein